MADGFWENFHGPNRGYIEEQYELFEKDPDAVDPSIKSMFEKYGVPVWLDQGITDATPALTNQVNIEKVTAALKLVDAIRRYGHLEAEIYPVGKPSNRFSAVLDPGTYGLEDQDLKDIPSEWIWPEAPNHLNNGFEAVQELKDIYIGTIAFEFDHVDNEEERAFLQKQVESGHYRVDLSSQQKKQLLNRLAEVEGFEQFLGKTFVAQKRFSIEGLDMMVPMLDHIIESSCDDETEHIMMGMAHRGRLNVLAHILGKPYDHIFSEFHHSPNKDLVPSEGSMGINYGWTGDVKYHFGAHRVVNTEEEEGPCTRVTLAHNPSHLEFVNPVVEGFTRAVQDDRNQKGYPKQNVDKAFSILIHGDAAFPGEGVVAETLNMSDLPGYSSGGTVHIIANNMVGFTTPREQGRSTRYSSDVAKGYEIPIIHVNADDPIACLSAVKLAYQYRKRFHKDILIDLVGYRRYGHNEMDEPRATQPILYKEIDEHDTVAKLYADRLEKDGVVDSRYFNQVKEEIESKLRKVFENMKEDEKKQEDHVKIPDVVEANLEDISTEVDLDRLKSINESLLQLPENFEMYQKLGRMLKKRKKAFDEGSKVDWALAEALAFAAILQDGTPIRLTGQDTERGTFAHRHLVLHDVNGNDTYSPMHGIPDVKVSFDIRNSPLSEIGVLGFEYGYSVQAKDALVLWEAQYGDFANAGQVIIDQFIAAGRAKWGQATNMVLLLPHGYEGQGPEHSSARLERYLQLAAENNWSVVNVTSAAQYFHLLRRQAAISGTARARPLIVMSPKSLIRNDRIADDPVEFTKRSFMPILEEALSDDPKIVERLILGSGKVMVDISEYVDQNKGNWSKNHIVKVEEIYPFPEKRVAEVLKKYPNVKEVVWVQEEPKNMGSWDFVKGTLHHLLTEEQQLTYIGRPNRSSTAVGEPNIHKTEQQRIITEALKPSKGGETRERD
ncbi:2-oxoglutarate dehydrogenase E1 component [Bacillaceae bacterium S4-13-56]